MNANDEPRNAGTLPFVRKWNSKVPSPANSSVAATGSPVSTGTRIVAPNMANMCWKPSSSILGTPSVLASGFRFQTSYPSILLMEARRASVFYAHPRAGDRWTPRDFQKKCPADGRDMNVFPDALPESLRACHCYNYIRRTRARKAELR